MKNRTRDLPGIHKMSDAGVWSGSTLLENLRNCQIKNQTTHGGFYAWIFSVMLPVEAAHSHASFVFRMVPLDRSCSVPNQPGH
jgi:hypothetical protein